jgi:dimethylhistidine N-methyltransferase
MKEDQLLLNEVFQGLSKQQKTIAAKFLYDKRGSEIFESICQLKDYYPTRAENEILQVHGKEIAAIIGEQALVIEPGSGSGDKIRKLFKHLTHPVVYIPIEISKIMLIKMAKELEEEFPLISVFPLCEDFTKPVNLPINIHSLRQRGVLFFPGSTIGNLNPQEAIDFLVRYGNLLGPGGSLLIGADLKKDSDILIRAYDDPEGVTAAFNLNLLHRLNREASATFKTQNFYHRAIYNWVHGRIEMHLVSKIPQSVEVKNTVFHFNQEETIHTESSYKYTIEEFRQLCLKAKLSLVHTWQDSGKLFCVFHLVKT